MALEFPANPADGDVYPAAPNSEYVYNDAKGAWTSLPTESAKTITSDIAPVNAKDGDQWFNSIDGCLYIYYVDVDGGQWLQVKNDASFSSTLGPRVDALDASGNVNYVINGGFDIWQRGTTATLGSTGLTNYYTADRWATYNPTGTGVLAQDTTNVPAGLRYGLRFTSSASNSSCNFYHTIETANSSQLAGKTVTLSAYISGTAGVTTQLALGYSTTVDNTWTGSFPTIASINPVTTTTPTRFSVTAVVPANAKTLQVFFGSGFLSNTSYVSFTGVQLQEGSVATSFHRAAPTIQGELAACQRYYLKVIDSFAGATRNTIDMYTPNWRYPVPMRVAPTLEAGATYRASAGNAGTVTPGGAAGESTIWGMYFYNGANNWTSNANIFITFGVSAEL